MEEKKLGIELIKKAIKFLYDITIEGIEAFKDKRLFLHEILGFSDNIYSGVVLGMKYDQIVAELKDLDGDEYDEIFVYVSELVKNVTSDEIDLIIDNVIEVINAEIVIYKKNISPIIEIIKKKKETGTQV